MEQKHGILLLNKPKGMSSAFAIGRLKKLGQKKIGHAGTLDPMATGLLIVLLGEATKISGYLLENGEAPSACVRRCQGRDGRTGGGELGTTQTEGKRRQQTRAERRPGGPAFAHQGLSRAG